MLRETKRTETEWEDLFSPVRLLEGAFQKDSSLINPVNTAVENVYSIFEQKNILAKEVESLRKDKEILLEELHHRVRNNLAMIMGIIEMQSEELSGDPLLSLRDTQKRVGTFVKVHELIFSQNDLKNIPVHELIKKLYAQHKDNGPAFAWSVRIDELYININQAIPLGLICNELLSRLRNRLCNIDAVILNSDLSGLPEVDIFFTIQRAEKQMGEHPLWDDNSFEGRFINLLALQLKASMETNHSPDTTTLHIKFTKAEVSGAYADRFI